MFNPRTSPRDHTSDRPACSLGGHDRVEGAVMRDAVALPMRPGRGAQLGKNVIAAVSEIAFGPHAMPPTVLW